MGTCGVWSQVESNIRTKIMEKVSVMRTGGPLCFKSIIYEWEKSIVVKWRITVRRKESWFDFIGCAELIYLTYYQWSFVWKSKANFWMKSWGLLPALPVIIGVLIINPTSEKAAKKTVIHKRGSIQLTSAAWLYDRRIFPEYCNSALVVAGVELDSWCTFNIN